MAFNITGTWVATLYVEYSNGDGNWTAMNNSWFPVYATFGSQTQVNTQVIAAMSGYSYVRIRAAAYTSGTANVSWSVGQGAAYMQQGAPAAVNEAWPVYTTGVSVVAFSSGSITNPLYTLSTATENFPTIAPGVRASTGATVQELKDTGRQVIISSAAAVTGITTEALFTVTTSTNLAPGATGTSFGVTPGKILRFQNISYVARATGVTAVSGTLRLRAMASGACTATSPIISELGVNSQIGSGTAVDHLTYPDGLELSGTQTFCISHVESTTSSTADVVLMGYQY